MVKDIKKKDLNKQLNNSFAWLRLFPGATLKHLKHYVAPSLIDETPEKIILHGWCIDHIGKSSTPEKIANEMVDTAILCRYQWWFIEKVNF